MTDTRYTDVGNFYSGSANSVSDYLEQSIGQTFGYQIGQHVIGVIDLRAADTSFPNNSIFDSNTYYILGGADVTLTRATDSPPPS